MSLNYIRNFYGVPAFRGREIVYTGGSNGQQRKGKILGSSGPYIRVRFDGELRPLLLHPTWEVAYLD